jgi:hypothetical protein
MKPVRVRRIALFRDCCRLEKLRPKPLSNNRMTRVSVVKTGPTMPKEPEFTILNIGPSKSPRPIKGRTSGIRFFSKIAAKRCARKMSAPTAAIAIDVRITALPKIPNFNA